MTTSDSAAPEEQEKEEGKPTSSSSHWPDTPRLPSSRETALPSRARRDGATLRADSQMAAASCWPPA